MRFLLLLSTALLFLSCSVQAKVTIPANGVGPVPVEASFHLESPAWSAWKNLRDLDDTLPADPFDPSLLQKGLGPGSTVTSTRGTTTLAFAVASPANLFPGMKADSQTWDLTLDRAGVRRLAGLTSWADSPALDAFLPAPAAKITEEEYRDLMVYLLGTPLTEAAAKALIEASTVQLTIEAPRTIQSAPGASALSGKTATYRWPLVKVLVLATPIRLKITF